MSMPQLYRPILVIAGHVALSLILLSKPWNLSELFGWGVIAVPMSQNGPVAIWACTGRLPLVRRMFLWPFGLVSTWALTCALMPWSPDSPFAAAWGVGLLLQALLIGVILGTMALVRSPWASMMGRSRWRHDKLRCGTCSCLWWS